MVKVKISFQGQTVDFDLNRDSPFQTVIDAICTQLNAPGPKTDYSLQLDSTGQHISPQDLSNAQGFPIASGALFNLRVKPDIAAHKIIEQLRDPKFSKKAIFDLQKTHLSDEAFARRFLSMNGLAMILQAVSESQGSQLAYALKALHGAMKYNTGYEAITEPFLTTYLFPHINSPNINVCKSALEVAALVAQSEKLAFAVADRCIRQSSVDNRPYSNVVQALSSTDVGIQANALELLNSLYMTVPDPQSQKYLDDTLEGLALSKTLKKLVKSVQDERLKLQAYIYQAQRLKRLARWKEIAYDKTNQQHEDMLLRLWEVTFPGVQLSARVSDQWKTMGFQGTDPATDFRGMGLLGLYNLLYFGENLGDLWRGIIQRNIERKEREYPAAVAGINITQMLFELLQLGKPINYQGPPLKIFRVVFDHPAAFEEMYCRTFQALDRTWDDMNASYMDFPKVIAAVRKQIEDVLEVNPISLDVFSRAVTKEGVAGEQEDDDNEHPQIKAIKSSIRKETYDMYVNNRMEKLKDGCNFAALGKLKEATGKSKAAYVFLKMDASLQSVQYAMVNGPSDTATLFQNTVPKTEIQRILLGKDCPTVQKAKKFEEGDVKRVFGLALKDREIELLAHSQTDYLNWIDGLRLFIGGTMLEKDNLDELASLTNMFINVRLVDLAGIQLPEDPPHVPPAPTNFDFASDADHGATADAGAGAGAEMPSSDPGSPQMQDYSQQQMQQMQQMQQHQQQQTQQQYGGQYDAQYGAQYGGGYTGY